MGSSTSESIKEGDWVLLYFDEKRKYVVRVEAGRHFHTTMGGIDLSSLIGKKFGDRGETNVGEPFVISRPRLVDLLETFHRFTQVIYPKDLGYILLSSGVGPGAKVVEAGTGTGYLASVLAYYVKPSGRVFTYEARKDFYLKAVKNFESIGLLPYITAKNKNIKDGIDEEDVDAVFLDLPDPWSIVDLAYDALIHGGSIVVFVPTVNQVERAVVALKKKGFKLIESVEIMMRKLKAVQGEMRPETIGVWHTGYIVRAQKL